MSKKPRSERKTQDRVVALFTDDKRDGNLGYYYLGNLSKEERNRCVRAELELNLERRGYSGAHITRALEELHKAIDSTGTTLYAANLRTYQLLRYGVQVKVSEARPHETVHLCIEMTIDEDDARRGNRGQQRGIDGHRHGLRKAAAFQLAQRGVFPAFRALRQAVAQHFVQQRAAAGVALEACGQRVEQGAHQAASGASRSLIQS